MPSEKRLPKIIQLRVENILKKGISSAYPTGTEDVVKVVLPDNSITYVNLITRKEVKQRDTQNKPTATVLAEPVAEQPPQGQYGSMITRGSLTQETQEEQPVKKSVTKSTRKKGTRKPKK